jgi:hypothetical protein
MVLFRWHGSLVQRQSWPLALRSFYHSQNQNSAFRGRTFILVCCFELSPLFATLTKTAGCVSKIPILEPLAPATNRMRLSISHWPELANRPGRLFPRFPFNFQLSTVNLFRLNLPTCKPSNDSAFLDLSPFPSCSSALFCTHAKLNPFIFKGFRTLCEKHPGVG